MDRETVIPDIGSVVTGLANSPQTNTLMEVDAYMNDPTCRIGTCPLPGRMRDVRDSIKRRSKLMMRESSR